MFRATVYKVRYLMRAKGMFALDAFRAFDSGRKGVLGCSELYGGLEWLGLTITPNEIYDLVRAIDSDHDGQVSLEDFCTAFHADDTGQGAGAGAGNK